MSAFSRIPVANDKNMLLFKLIVFCLFKLPTNSISKSMMIPRRPGGGDEAYYTYVEEADDPGLRRGRLCQQR